VNWFDDFSKNGFVKVPAVDMAPLNEVRNYIIEQIKICFNTHSEEKNIDLFLDRIHQLKMSDGDLNTGKLKLIESCTAKGDIGKLLYQAFRVYIDTLLGPDLLMQKNTNIILFPPNYEHYTEPHRDAPLNSAFELVFWIPLNRCYGTKSLYILNIEKSKKAFELLKSENSFKKFESFCQNEGDYLEANFGEACIFWTGLAHGSVANKENETRWTLNMRYKNAYSPNGVKDTLQFFEILKLSPVSEFAIAMQKEILLS